MICIKYKFKHFVLINFELLALTLTDDEDLCRLIPRCLWLCSLYLLEELLEDPEQWLVVFGAEDFCHKSATFGQKFTSQLQSHQGQMSCGCKGEGRRFSFNYSQECNQNKKKMIGKNLRLFFNCMQMLC